ncbi:MAG: S41 family peptidase [Brevefilum sp.]
MTEQKPNKFLSWWGFIALQVAIVLLAGAAGAFGYRYMDQQRGELALLRQAREILVKNTIHDVPSDQQLEYGMIRGMLNTVEDPFTRFVPPAEHEVQTDQLAGEFGGIGARLERDTQNRWRLYPLPNSPALEIGLEDGDLLLAVGEQAISADTDEVTLISLLRGPVGDKVQITIQRDEKEHTFTLKRHKIDLPSIATNLLPEDERIGLVQVIRIAETTTEEIKNGIQSLQNQGASALILDLRDNGGGLVDTGVQISRLFLTEGQIMRQQFRDEDVETFRTEEPGPFDEIPLVIFINGNTASAAEIIAGALNTHQRAPLIGLPSYGKTSIQYIFDLPDGSSVHVTSGRWWVPGVEFPLQPNFSLPQDAAEPAFIQKAIEVLTAQLP